MAKRQIKYTICSFCVESFPDKEMFTVRLPMHRLTDGTTRGEYRTPCCKKCIGKEETKERILGIHESPKEAKSK